MGWGLDTGAGLGLDGDVDLRVNFGLIYPKRNLAGLLPPYSTLLR